MNVIRISLSHPHETIVQRAREIWLQLGQPDGQDLAIWLEAERELSERRRAVDQELLQETFDSFDYMTGRRGPTSLDLT